MNPTTSTGQRSGLAAFLIAVVLTAAAAGLGGLYLPGAWYDSLAKPAWTPPDWVFAPVWFALYVMIALAGRILWQRPQARIARNWWVVQIVLVGLWTPLFFGLHAVGPALVDIVLLWFAIGACVVTAWRSAPTAAWLMLPYWLWVSYATTLNAGIFLMN